MRGLVIAAVIVVALFPVYWMVLSTFQPEGKTLSFPPPLFLKGFNTGAISQLFRDQPIASWLGHSVFVAVITVAITLVLASFGAYLLGRLEWHGKLLFGLLLLFTQMMPGAMIIVPELQFYRSMGWTNNLPMLAVLYAAFNVPLGSWILKSSFDNVPDSVLDAGLVDGCTRLGVLRRLLLPLSRAGLVAVAVVAFFGSWNDYLFASALITNRSQYTAGLGIATFISQQDVPIFELQAAGVVFSLLPVIFYMCVQRYVVRGLTAGAVKG
ncbi:MAG TPA: carbohydrate ABC transporter permease [Streptosporangiaceae bacterium]|nr:carbohydrate ABC transporter permease [Streptosporangiaceae bacterium]